MPEAGFLGRSEGSTSGVRIATIGHSTRPLAEFLELLRAHRVSALVDVRTVPRSRRHPQFEQRALADSLAEAGMRYAHRPGLGGLRRPAPDSINLGWKAEGFRGFADHMQTAEFESEIEGLVEQAAAGGAAIMCAEALPWRCHRSLIADALVARGVRVEHIMGTAPPRPHILTPWARVEGMRVLYPSPEAGR